MVNGDLADARAGVSSANTGKMQTRAHLHWFRFRLRTLFAAVGVIAVPFAIGPPVWHRYQVNRAVESAVATGSKSDLDLLLSDSERVVTNLLRTVEVEGIKHGVNRRVNAIQTLDAILEQSDSAPLRERALHSLIDAITSDSVSSEKERVLFAIGKWLPSTGVDPVRRIALISTLVQQTPQFSPAAAKVLLELGGRKGTLLVLNRADSADPALAWEIHSKLRISIWPGLMPYLRTWLKNPTLEATALDYDILPLRPDGRRLLLDYAIDRSRPMALRQKAVDGLQETQAGAKLLLVACENDDDRASLAAVVGPDPRKTFRAVATTLRQYYADKLWQELITNTSKQEWAPGRHSAEVDERMQLMNRASVSVNVRVLRMLSGRSDLRTKVEWQQWYEATLPGAVSQRRLLEVVLDEPKLLTSCSALLRRFIPNNLGYIPDDCLPLYRRMLRHADPNLRFWACMALVQYDRDLAEAVPATIKLVRTEGRSDVPTVQSGTIYLLQRRFAVNYFWDVDAWERWWKAKQGLGAGD